MKKNRAIAPVIAGLLSALALTACSNDVSAAGSGDSDSAELVELNVGFPWNGAAGKTPAATGWFGYAVGTGAAEPILKKHGFTLGKQVGFNNGPPVAQAIEAGDIQVGLIGDVPAALARATGLGVEAAAILRPTSDIWIITRKGGPTSVKDLAGKKVALQFGSNFDKYGRAVLEKEGILDQVEPVNLLFADTLPALQKGEVDATVVPASTAGIWSKTAEFPVISKGHEDYPDLLATSVLLVGSKFRKEHPDVAQAVWEVNRAGQEAAAKDHDAFLEWNSEATGAPLDALKGEQLFQFSDQPADPDGVRTTESTLAWLVENGSAPKSFDVKDWVVAK